MRNCRYKLWLCSLFLLLGCGYAYQGARQVSPREGTITGRVTLEVGLDLEDVDVALFALDDVGQLAQGIQVSLDKQGWFRFQDLSPGEYYLEITKPRYDPYGEQIQLKEEEGISLEVRLGRYTIPEHIEAVSVVGDFVDWDPLRAVPMADDDGDGIWETHIPLPIGQHRYRYIINGLEEWFIDIKSGEYEPDGLGYYHSVVDLDQAQLVPFVLDTNDPWFRRAIFEVSVAEQESTGWVIWEPEEPRAGQWITIFYDARGGALEDAQQILLHWGVNDWTLPQLLPPDSQKVEESQAVQTPLERDPDGIWWVVIPTDAQVRTVDFVFTDGQRWDNQAGEWHIPMR